MRRHLPRLTRRQRVAAGVLAVLAALFLTVDLTGSGLRSAHSGVRGALGSLYRGTDAVLGPIRRFVQGVPHAGSNEQRVRALQHENAVLRRQLADSHADRRTAAELARLQLAARSSRHRVLPARVVAIGPAEGFDWTVTIDVGSSDGAATGQSVTDGAGLVGRVVHADSATSVVLLAVDPGSGVGARDLRNGAVGVATGTGQSGFRFRPLDPTIALRVGDRLSTGPSRSSSYVPGLAVGTITAVRVADDGTTLATVRPTTAAAELDLVGVILTAQPGDTSRVALRPAGGHGR